jgi:selenide,water dikinase
VRTPPTDPSSDEPRDDAAPDFRFVDPAAPDPDDFFVEFREANVDEIEIVEETEGLAEIETVPATDEEAIELTDADFIEDGSPDAESVVESGADAGSDAKSPGAASPPPLPTPPPPPPPPRQLVLIGAGHTHLQILKWWRRRPFPRTELTMVTAFDQAAYSGMLPSTLARLYQPEDMLIDMPKLCNHCGVRLIVDRANRLDPVGRIIEFAHQPSLAFDVASINIGSVPAAEPLWQSHRILISVKPLSTFVQRFEVRFHELVEQWRAAPGDEMLQIVVVGAGAAGVELALCLEQHKHELELPADVRIVDGNPSILTDFSPAAVRRVEKLLKLRGIDLSLGSPVQDCDDEGAGELILENGQRIRADLVIWAAGAAPPMALRGFDLPKTPRGFLATRPTLQTTADAPVFVSGDAADFESHPIPKAGVFAVRQAPILWRNLKNCLSQSPLVTFQPQSSFLRLLSCGDGTAILDYKGFTSHSGWAWMLKNRIDRNWVRKFQVR